MPLNIAMDGPVGAGKSSIAAEVARRLGILHLDTGAMYRAIGLTALRRGVDVTDENAAVALSRELDISVAHEADGQHTFVNGEDVTGLIRTPEVSMAASSISKYLGVRQGMVALQQKLAAKTPMLVDGRDICLRVLPGATVKLYLTASAEERARRRWLEMQQKGASDTYEQVLEDLKKRDDQDMNREVDPLRPTEDAV
ncbi:MAG: (d)CMP kinase, partial [Clostridia bacterium]|nr:(d)CMP kinase [Clostridia bacterium]